ncbi:MAG: SUMF1/EgtB/PvdO family nonheme iron enzyme [Bacteroidales bacterium]|nr:SUMF1/EgtB/PvdO family nonheme iron enzyme [Bacteroidales bacterium]
MYLHTGDEVTVTTASTPEGYPFKWSSRDVNVATVDQTGKITATGIGQTDIIIASTYPYQNLSETVQVTVFSDDVYTFRSAYLKMIPVKGGTVTIGKEDYPLNPARVVTVGDFMLAEVEVSRQLWCAVVKKLVLSDVALCPYVDTYDAWETEFLAALREMTGKPFRFPTEAEWEYAAKAGENTTYSGGNDLNELGWHKGSPGVVLNFSYAAHYINLPMMSYKPNSWGFYDMSGNAAEWVSDIIPRIEGNLSILDPDDLKYQEELISQSESHIAKGGSAFSPASCCTIWSREAYSSNPNTFGPFGLRVAL